MPRNVHTIPGSKDSHRRVNAAVQAGRSLSPLTMAIRDVDRGKQGRAERRLNLAEQDGDEIREDDDTRMD